MKRIIQLLRKQGHNALANRVEASYYKTVTLRWTSQPSQNVEIFTDPSASDIKSIANLQSGYGSYVRLLVGKNEPHKVYMWDGEGSEHERVAKALGFDIHQFHTGIATIRGRLLNLRNSGYEHLEQYIPKSILDTEYYDD